MGAALPVLGIIGSVVSGVGSIIGGVSVHDGLNNAANAGSKLAEAVDVASKVVNIQGAALTAAFQTSVLELSNAIRDLGLSNEAAATTLAQSIGNAAQVFDSTIEKAVLEACITLNRAVASITSTLLCITVISMFTILYTHVMSFRVKVNALAKGLWAHLQTSNGRISVAFIMLTLIILAENQNRQLELLTMRVEYHKALAELKFEYSQTFATVHLKSNHHASTTIDSSTVTSSSVFVPSSSSRPGSLWIGDWNLHLTSFMHGNMLRFVQDHIGAPLAKKITFDLPGVNSLTQGPPDQRFTISAS